MDCTCDWRNWHVADFTCYCTCHPHHLRGPDLLYQRTREYFMDNDSPLRHHFLCGIIIPLCLAQPLRKIRCHLSIACDKRLATARCQVGCVPTGARIRM